MDLHNFALYRGKSIELDKNVESTSPCSQGEDEFSTCGSLHYSSSKNVMSASKDTSVKKLTDTPGKFDSWPNENFTGVEKGDSFSAPGVSVCFGRPMAGLKPGMPKDSESLSFRSNPMSSKTAKRSRMSYQSMQTSCCQVEGCNLDLSSAKDYHRRHRICESHSKSPKVIVAGVERRFCQQCSRFHNLSEFDDKKRSCRRRLSDHNARRRRPQPEALNLSSVGFSSSLYDRRPPNYLLNRMPSSSSDTTWESCCSLKMSQAVNSMIRTSGIDASSANSHLNEATNLPLALSLLSTATWGLNVPESNSLEQIMQATVSIAQPVMQMESQNWQTAEQAPSISPLHSVVLQSTDISHFQDFRLLKPP